MTKNTIKNILPSTLPHQLLDENLITSWIAEITNTPKNTVTARLKDEFNSPGINVARDFKKANLTPYTWSPALGDFYKNTDAFLYELVIWNLNRLKRRMRRRLANFLHSPKKHPNVLIIGDGLGCDSLYLAQSGYNVTYFELPGYSSTFAKKLFSLYPKNITVLTNPDDIRREYYDAVICLDVLEHVPNPPDFIKNITTYLKQNGILITHTPFFMIHPSNPTHLKQNRKFSGSLKLFRRQGLKFVEGRIDWNPIVLQKKSQNSNFSLTQFAKLIAVKTTGLYLALGRFSNAPFKWVDSYRKNKNKWLEK